MTHFTIAFIGLPSSGKSSIINSLIGKRILESGICRTTTEYNLLDYIIEDDNNNKFQVMDLPGICDSEEHNVNFNELTNKHIINANLIIWTSDVNKAFITTHEVNEYNKIKKILNDASNETGKLYHLIIMLSKCDKDINNNVIKKKDKKIKKSNEEIYDSDEDTNINDLIKKVHEKFSNEDIIYFNAFGRSFYNKKSTETLIKFISKTSIYLVITQHNITFDITKYINNYDINQIDTYYDHFQKKFILFKDTPTSKVEEILEIWNNISDENKNIFLSKLFEDYPTFDIKNAMYLKVLKIFQFISCETIIKYNNTNILHNKLIDYYLFLLNNINNSFNINYCNYSKEDLIERINTSFKLLNYNQQELFYNKLLFDDSFICESRCDIILNLDWSKKNYYNFEIMFNKYINSDLSNNDITKFANTIGTLINKKYELKYDKTKTIGDNFYDYLSVLDDIYNDYDYILLNKVQILYNIIKNTNAFHTNYHINCSYYKLIKSFNDILYNRLINNQKWLDMNDKIWRKIYSNIQVEYNFDFDMDNFIPINKLELLYDSKDI